MSNHGNFYMSTTLNFGSERQPQEVLVDTGSSWLWTYGDNCPADSSRDICSHSKNVFHPMESKTFETTGQTKYIKYGKGSVKGDIVMDTVSIGTSEDGDELKADAFSFMVKYIDPVTL